MIANLKLAIILRHQGRLQQVIEICQQQMQLTSKMGRITVGTPRFPVLV
jgi:hypothetical protein